MMMIEALIVKQTEHGMQTTSTLYGEEDKILQRSWCRANNEETDC
jgi:hypothetical protein